MSLDIIDRSLQEPINSDNEDYIMRKIREDYLSDSTVTIHLIGQYSAENAFLQNQRFIKRELQASLYNSAISRRNGILGVVLPDMSSNIFKGSYACSTCGNQHNSVAINDSTVVKEFSQNYYIPAENKCSWAPEDRYCVLTDWDSFAADPAEYIEQAFVKRTAKISEDVIVFPK